MTRNEAIKCLELEDGFTSEDVKHSYARLTKTVRPEEKPEEFSKLNEAYRLLSAELRRRGRNANMSDTCAKKNETNKSVEENSEKGTQQKLMKPIEVCLQKEVMYQRNGNLSKVTDISKTESYIKK